MKLLFLAITCSLTISAHAQFNTEAFNKERYRINQTGFLVLSSWSAANMITGAIGMSTASGEAKYFHQMNLIWGAVNMVVAIPGYIGAKRSNASLPFDATVRGQAAAEKTFIFNAGLDIAYTVAGAWFIQKSKTASNPDRYNGYGKSIIVQGIGLLLFDAIMFSTHNHHGKKLYKVLSGIQASPNSLGMNIRL